MWILWGAVGLLVVVALVMVISLAIGKGRSRDWEREDAEQMEALGKMRKDKGAQGIRIAVIKMLVCTENIVYKIQLLRLDGSRISAAPLNLICAAVPVYIIRKIRIDQKISVVIFDHHSLLSEIEQRRLLFGKLRIENKISCHDTPPFLGTF